MKTLSSLTVFVLSLLVLGYASNGYGKGSSLPIEIQPNTPIQLMKIIDEINKAAIVGSDTKKSDIDEASSNSLKKQHQKFLEMATIQHIETAEGWKREHAETLKRWSKEHQTFLKNMGKYRRGLVDFNFLIEKGFKDNRIFDVTKPLVYVRESYEIPVRNQMYRGTCAAFAGIRAIEIMLKRRGTHKNLSEHYFYWASRPDCQQTPCSKSGSWVTTLFQKSAQSTRFDIPTEQTCPYNPREVPSNVTQTPVSQSCRNGGYVRVSKYSSRVTISEILKSLDAGQTVIGAFRLDDSFFKTEGYIHKLSNNDLIESRHKKGHALLITGYIRLPDGMSDSICFLVNNSWGEGWGSGGHACISERWFKAMRFKVPFIALEGIATK